MGDKLRDRKKKSEREKNELKGKLNGTNLKIGKYKQPNRNRVRDAKNGKI